MAYTSISLKSRLAEAASVDKQHNPSPLLGIWLCLGSLEAATCLAHELNYDFMVIDAEHAPLDPSRMTQMVRAVSLGSNGRTAPIVRLPASNLEWIKWALDSGASGIILPMVQTAQQMRDILSKALYPPRGQRSFGPFQAPFAIPRSIEGLTLTNNTLQKPSMMTYAVTHCKEVAILPLLESRDGVKNAEEILTIDGVDGCLIGPVDLCLSLGLSSMTSSILPPHPVYVGALQKVLNAAKKAGNKPVGIVVDALSKSSSEHAMALAKARKKEGFAFMTIGADVLHLTESLRNTLLAARQTLE
jgi:2-keto-3-deoxy-L-rhamnonate aldolase RhmA